MKIKDIFTNWIVKNVLLAVAFVLVLVFSVNALLAVGTRHNKEITVPDFSGMSVEEAQTAASAVGVMAGVTDSIYVRRMTPGALYMQTPKAGSHVKKGRKIRLTANTVVPSEVYMPSLIGCSLRQAKAELQRNGLELGRLIYVKDIATNYVLKQQRYGVDVAPGTPMSSGTVINLVLGLSSDNLTNVPDLSGKQYRAAVDMAQENSLNIGRLRFDNTVKNYADTLSAVVYRQNPAADAPAVTKGSELTLYLTLDTEKVPAGKTPAEK